MIGANRILGRQDALVQRRVGHLEQRMAAAAVEQGALFVERQVLQAGQGIDQRQHAQVEMAIEHAGLDLAGQGHADVDHHVGRSALEGGQGMGDAHARLGDQVVDDAEVQLATQVLVQLVDLAAKAFQGGEQRLAGLEHLAAFVGQRETGATALTEAHAQALFQIVHVQADGRAGDAQPAFGGSETAAFHHRLEQPQQADLEIADLGEQGLARRLHDCHRKCGTA